MYSVTLRLVSVSFWNPPFTTLASQHIEHLRILIKILDVPDTANSIIQQIQFSPDNQTIALWFTLIQRLVKTLKIS